MVIFHVSTFILHLHSLVVMIYRDYDFTLWACRCSGMHHGMGTGSVFPGESMTEHSTAQCDNGADQQNDADGKCVIQRTADGAGENVAEGDHAESKSLAFRRVLVVDVAVDILHHRRRDHRKGEKLQRVCTVQTAHAGSKSNGQRLQNKHGGGESHSSLTAEAAEKTVIQKHHRDLHEGGEAAEQPHVGSVTVHRAHDIDQIVVDQIMGKEKQ